MNFDFTGPLVHNHVLDWNINCDDFGDQAAGKLGAKPAALAGRMPRAEQECGRRDFEQCRGILSLRFGQTLADVGLHERRVFAMAVAQNSVIDPMRCVE